jgi:putative ABC transport system substrate-binding protein
MWLDRLERRAFIALVAGAAAVRPAFAWAQQRDRMRRIGVLMTVGAGAPEGQSRLTAFAQGLQEYGWSEGRNVAIEYRWAAGNPELARKYAAELLALAPDVILAGGTPSVVPLRQMTRTVPIVFVQVADPVGAGLVESLGRPGGNLTGFTNFEYSLSGKWLELLMEIAPGAKRVAVLRDAASVAGVGQFAAIQSVASSLKVELKPIDVHDAGEIERGLTALAREPDGGVIVTASGLAVTHRDLIVKLAARHRLPAVYAFRSDVTGGGLIFYGPDSIEPHRRAAGYVHRILNGERPSELPVQAPTRFELVINLKTAKALDLQIPPTVLARADEVIE